MSVSFHRAWGAIGRRRLASLLPLVGLGVIASLLPGCLSAGGLAAFGASFDHHGTVRPTFVGSLGAGFGGGDEEKVGLHFMGVATEVHLDKDEGAFTRVGPSMGVVLQPEGQKGFALQGNLNGYFEFDGTEEGGMGIALVGSPLYQVARRTGSSGTYDEDDKGYELIPSFVHNAWSFNIGACLSVGFGLRQGEPIFVGFAGAAVSGTVIQY